MKRKRIHREPMTSDVIFKAVFGQDTPECKAALIELLNLILEREEDPIVDLTYLNPFSIAEAEKEKVIIMDIKVKTGNGELIDIEMQIGNLCIYVNRSIFYGCKQLTKGLERGEDYGKMKKSIVISFVKDILFPQEVPMHSVFTLRERASGRPLSDFLELHYIELGKVDWKGKAADMLSPLEQFAAYLSCTGNEDESNFVETLVQEGVKVITMADTVLRKISEEERLQALREDREMAVIFNRMEREAAIEEGIKQGIKRGIEQGIEQGTKQGIEQGIKQGIEQGTKQGVEQGHAEAMREAARNFKNDGIPLDVIARNTGLSIEEIDAL